MILNTQNTPTSYIHTYVHNTTSLCLSPTTQHIQFSLHAITTLASVIIFAPYIKME